MTKKNETLTTDKVMQYEPLLTTVFSDIEKFKHSIYIQKLSSTTYTNDCKDLKNMDMASKFGYENSLPNIWRVKLGKSGSWIYFKTIIEVLFFLEKNCG